MVKVFVIPNKSVIKNNLLIWYFYYTVTTFKYVEGGLDSEATEVVWNTSSYI